MSFLHLFHQVCSDNKICCWLVVWVYGVSTFLGYLMSNPFYTNCDTMGSFIFCGCGCQSKNPFVCFGAKSTQRVGARDLPRDRKKAREGRYHRQWAWQNSQQKGAEETSRQNRSVRRWKSGREETYQQNSERRLLGPVDLQMLVWPTREDESVFLVALWKFRAITRPR